MGLNDCSGRYVDHELGYEDRRNSLKALVQTYLSTMRDIGIETFIVHGTLLGWYANLRDQHCRHNVILKHKLTRERKVVESPDHALG